LSPTLEDLVRWRIQAKGHGKGVPARLRIVHRLDKETSGLVVFARSVPAERLLGKQFHDHTVVRVYLAVVPGRLESQTIRSRLVRDRSDGRRGSTTVHGLGKPAVTHVEVVERLRGYTLVRCRLETGRTHQIRIHLAELGHPVCGEKVYHKQLNRSVKADVSRPPRLALHAAVLGFVHPATRRTLHWEMPLPADLAMFLDEIRSQRSPEARG
jgi:23S rRNA pseudouridine1911/1915/1917 synthase